MLKLRRFLPAALGLFQPPSGGCVLKRACIGCLGRLVSPAAFRRLCVETEKVVLNFPECSPAAFRRLCVETIELDLMDEYGMASRLQAAVC